MSRAAKVASVAVTMVLPASGSARTEQRPVMDRRLSIEAAWSTGATGTFSLECSFDGGTTWRTVPGASAEFTANGQLQPANSASFAVWNFINVPGGLWRIAYTGTGAGTANFKFSWAA